MILSPDNYDSWMCVGFCLHSASEELVWVEFSRRSGKFKEGECEELWGKMKADGGISLGSLHYWARCDALCEYRAILNQRLLNDSDASHNSVARIASKILFGRFMCASSDSKVWYSFDGSLWRVEPSAVGVHAALATVVHDHFMQAVSALQSRMSIEDMQSDASRGGRATASPPSRTS